MNIKVCDFQERWLEDLAYEFYKFNRNNPVKMFSNVSEVKTFKSKLDYFKNAVRSMNSRCDYNYLAIDQTKNKIYMFCSFKIKENICTNYWIFKSVDYPLNKHFFKTQFKFLDKMKQKGFTKVIANIDRVNGNPLLKFCQRYYGSNAQQIEGEGEKVVFDLEKNTRWKYYLDK
jgi:hypothetical protein